MVINDVQFDASLEEIIKELRSQLAVNGIKLLQKEPKQSGDHLQVQCIYHANGQEKRPSAGIRLSDGIYHCFACGEIHSLPEVISHCFGHYDDITGSWGWKWLLQNFSSVSIEERKDVVLDFDRNMADADTACKSGRRQEQSVAEEELESYRYIHPYMYKRKLTDEIIELFDIGYDKATQCITFPIRDINGNTLFIARRSVNFKYFNYPQGAEKPVYGIYELSLVKRQYDEIIVCESMLDALTCWVYGKYAVALNGLGNDLQFRQLEELPTRKLILATDNDDAGMKARERIRKHVRRKLITEYVLPENRKDINELSKEEFENLEEIF